MLRPIIRSLALSLFTLSSMTAAIAAKPEQVSFEYKDWSLQCDNTRTCRAAGYQADTGESGSDPVSLLLTRAAGPNTPVEMQLQVQSEQTVSGALQLKAGRLLIDGLQGDSPQIPAAKVSALLQELLRNEKVSVRAGQQTWTLSLAGVNAVLLKMDEAQGRIATPGALVRRGSKPEASVLAPLPAPVVKAVKPAALRRNDQALIQQAFASLPKKVRDEAREQCNDNALSGQLEAGRLDEHTLLIAMSCSVGAYNSITLLWTSNDRPPFKVEALDIEGEFDQETGIVTSSMKGRGLGDCWSNSSWQYDGKGFTLTSQSSDSMCRGFPGGAWNLPSYVSKTVPQQ